MKRKIDIKQAKELQTGLDEMSAIIAEEKNARNQNVDTLKSRNPKRMRPARSSISS